MLGGVFGTVPTEVFFRKYLTEVFGELRYGLKILPNTPIRFGANFDAGTRHFGKFGTPTKQQGTGLGF